MSPFSLSIVSGSYIQAALGGGLADAFVRHVRSARERTGKVFFCLLFFSSKRKVRERELE